MAGALTILAALLLLAIGICPKESRFAETCIYVILRFAPGTFYFITIFIFTANISVSQTGILALFPKNM